MSNYPTGRPITPTGLRLRASKHADDALNALSEVMKTAPDPVARIEAAKTILDLTKGVGDAD
jgi:hypothetical protein